VLFFHQLEPDGLIAAFAAYPPDGFTVLDGAGPHAAASPVFAACFDLLTTAEPALKKRAAALPLFKHWSRWLRVQTAFVGTTVSEYAPFSRDSVPAHLLATLIERWGSRFRLLIVKDIPSASPLLAAADNAYAQALVRACTDAGFVLVEGQALAYVVIDFPNIDAYLRRLSSSRRQNLRRKLRSRAELEIRRILTGSDIFRDDAVIDAYYALYSAVFAQSDVHFDRLTRSFFSCVLRSAGTGGLVFEYWRDGVLIGWNLCFETDGKLVDKYIGFRYPEARACNLYFVSWMVNLEYAVERGLTHYVAGWTDPQVKAQLGASFTFTRHAVYVRNPVLRWLAPRFVSHFESDRTLFESST
jgi:hypothetical protein